MFRATISAADEANKAGTSTYGPQTGALGAASGQRAFPLGESIVEKHQSCRSARGLDVTCKPL